jgi:hypothetical protein
LQLHESVMASAKIFVTFNLSAMKVSALYNCNIGSCLLLTSFIAGTIDEVKCKGNNVSTCFHNVLLGSQIA